MTGKIVQQPSEFTAASRVEDIAPDVVEETRRTILDSIGCALAATHEPTGRIGIEIARMMGQNAPG